MIISQSEPFVPVAVVGLEQTNYFVDKKGQWQPDVYIPAYVRKYPFIFMETPENDQLTLCVDEVALAAEGDAKATPIFEGDEPSQTTKNALDFCGAHQGQHQNGVAFAKALMEKELLTPQRSQVKLASGRTINLAGFQSIDGEKLATLDEALLKAWHTNGFLPYAYYLLQSQSNWQTLLNMANRLENKK